MTIIYRAKLAPGEWEYWTYVDGSRVWLDVETVWRYVRNAVARIVDA